MKISKNIFRQKIGLNHPLQGSVVIHTVNTRLGDLLKLPEHSNYYQKVNDVWYEREFDPTIKYSKCGIALSTILNKICDGKRV